MPVSVELFRKGGRVSGVRKDLVSPGAAWRSAKEVALLRREQVRRHAADVAYIERLRILPSHIGAPIFENGHMPPERV
jgi:hypothetical protein